MKNKNRIRGKPKLTDKHKFTDKQEIFILEYLKDGNAARAAIAAGYAANSARNTGHKLLHEERFSYVREEVERRRNEKLKRLDCGVNEVLAICGAICTANPLDLLREDGSYKTLDEIDEKTRMAIEYVDREGVPHLYKKTEFVKMMMKRHGLLTDKTEITGSGGGAIEISWRKE